MVTSNPADPAFYASQRVMASGATPPNTYAPQEIRYSSRPQTADYAAARAQASPLSVIPDRRRLHPPGPVPALRPYAYSYAPGDEAFDAAGWATATDPATGAQWIKQPAAEWTKGQATPEAPWAVVNAPMAVPTPWTRIDTAPNDFLVSPTKDMRREITGTLETTSMVRSPQTATLADVTTAIQSILAVQENPLVLQIQALVDSLKTVCENLSANEIGKKQTDEPCRCKEACKARSRSMNSVAAGGTRAGSVRGRRCGSSGRKKLIEQVSSIVTERVLSELSKELSRGAVGEASGDNSEALDMRRSVKKLLMQEARERDDDSVTAGWKGGKGISADQKSAGGESNFGRPMSASIPAVIGAKRGASSKRSQNPRLSMDSTFKRRIDAAGLSQPPTPIADETAKRKIPPVYTRGASQTTTLAATNDSPTSRSPTHANVPLSVPGSGTVPLSMPLNQMVANMGGSMSVPMSPRDPTSVSGRVLCSLRIDTLMGDSGKSRRVDVVSLSDDLLFVESLALPSECDNIVETQKLLPVNFAEEETWQDSQLAVKSLLQSKDSCIQRLARRFAAVSKSDVAKMTNYLAIVVGQHQTVSTDMFAGQQAKTFLLALTGNDKGIAIEKEPNSGILINCQPGTGVCAPELNAIFSQNNIFLLATFAE